MESHREQRGERAGKILVVMRRGKKAKKSEQARLNAQVRDTCLDTQEVKNG